MITNIRKESGIPWTGKPVSRWLLSCVAVALLGTASPATAGHAGLIGPNDGTESGSTPPLSPDAWQVMEGTVLNPGDVWGSRIQPRAVFQAPGGIGLLYTSRPVLFKFDNTWAVLFARGDQPGPLRVALANIDPQSLKSSD